MQQRLAPPTSPTQFPSKTLAPPKTREESKRYVFQRVFSRCQGDLNDLAPPQALTWLKGIENRTAALPHPSKSVVADAVNTAERIAERVVRGTASKALCLATRNSTPLPFSEVEFALPKRLATAKLEYRLMVAALAMAHLADGRDGPMKALLAIKRSTGAPWKNESLAVCQALFRSHCQQDGITSIQGLRKAVAEDTAGNLRPAFHQTFRMLIGDPAAPFSKFEMIHLAYPGVFSVTRKGAPLVPLWLSPDRALWGNELGRALGEWAAAWFVESSGIKELPKNGKAENTALMSSLTRWSLCQPLRHYFKGDPRALVATGLEVLGRKAVVVPHSVVEVRALPTLYREQTPPAPARIASLMQHQLTSVKLPETFHHGVVTRAAPKDFGERWNGSFAVNIFEKALENNFVTTAYKTAARGEGLESGSVSKPLAILCRQLDVEFLIPKIIDLVTDYLVPGVKGSTADLKHLGVALEALQGDFLGNPESARTEMQNLVKGTLEGNSTLHFINRLVAALINEHHLYVEERKKFSVVPGAVRKGGARP